MFSGSSSWTFPTGGGWAAGTPPLHGMPAPMHYLHPRGVLGHSMDRAELDNARTANELAKAQEARRAQAFGMLSKHVSGGRSGGDGPRPNIDTNPIWDTRMTQQMVNSARAYNDQRTGTAVADMEESTAARGFGPQSPLIQALRTNLAMQNMAANSQAGTDIRMRTTGENASHRLAAQKAYEEEITRRRAIEQEEYNALLQALMGFAA